MNTKYSSIRTAPSETKPVLSQTTEMKIGRVMYIVSSHYKENGRETAEQKLLRFISNRVSAKS